MSNKTVKLIMVVEAELDANEIYDIKTLKEDLKDEAVKVKTGLYENHFYAYITDVKIVK